MWLLRDGRIVSGGSKGIVIFDKYIYQSDIFINDKDANTVCGLRNGNLAYADFEGKIKIYEIDENNHKLIHTLKEHHWTANKIIELEDGDYLHVVGNIK